MRADLPSGLNHRPFPLTLTPSAFHDLVLQGVVTDGRAGGLVVGRSYSEGGIYVVTQRGNDFFVHGSVEGGEFVLNKDASCRNLRRLNAMNSGRTEKEPVPPAALSDTAHFLDANAEPDAKLLWLNWSQVVVVARAAEKHLTELVAMNRAVNPFRCCDFNELFPPMEKGTEDGII